MTTVNRYLQALGRMADSANQEHRSFARKILRDLGEKGVRVQDYLKPYMTLPVAKLDHNEQALRKLAEQPTNRSTQCTD